MRKTVAATSRAKAWILIHASDLRRELIQALSLTRNLGGLWACVKRWWRALEAIQRHFLGNVVVGLSLLFVIMVLRHHHVAWVQDAEDAPMDWMMSLTRNVFIDDPGRALPMVFLDIDERTYQAWGEQILTPRGKLQELIELSAENGAEVVIVDVDLSRPAKLPPNVNTLPAGDRELLEYLQGYSAQCTERAGSASKGKRCTQILLMRSFRQPYDRPDALPQLRRSFLDPVVEASPDIHWVSNLFKRDADLRVRSWLLWEPACSSDGSGQVVPASQLISTKLILDRKLDAQAVDKEIEQALAGFKPSNCKTNAHQPAMWGKKLILGRQTNGDPITLDLNPSRIQEKILFKLPWKLFDGESYPEISWSGRKESLLLRYSSYDLLRTPEDDENSPQNGLAHLKGKIVIVGGSFRESGDLHLTPLGEMPGAMLVANAIYSLLEYGQITPPPWWMTLPMELLLILIMSVFFAGFDSFWGKVASGVLFVVLMPPASYFLFNCGIWLDFAVPLICMQGLRMLGACRI